MNLVHVEAAKSTRNAASQDRKTKSMCIAYAHNMLHKIVAIGAGMRKQTGI